MKSHTDTIRIAGIVKESIVDGPGIRFVIFTQGCLHHCMGCHNPQTHDLCGGYEIKIDDIKKMIEANPLLDGITISGGEPFLQAEKAVLLADFAHSLGLSVMTYTGYQFEELLAHMNQNPGWQDLLYATDTLVDGKFDITKKNLLLPFRGSTNQRIIDVKKSLASQRLVSKAV
ncbi:MAG: anaerobic ribonucleoside-triphosphate reductase activating protein [Epulopiscium sp.]|nr:anaerobic ribonucleoside-triphosphate reductase activating protein [Candidatus Epulonipiscium sp.]